MTMVFSGYQLGVPGLALKEHSLEVPLDWTNPDASPKIEVFAREVVRRDAVERVTTLPWAIYFQGGPGFASPRPHGNNGWLKSLLKVYRVLLLDQRGTGRSAAITARSLEVFKTPEEQAAYVAHFRQDSIVRDAEAFRQNLAADAWVLFGQSFGGWCITTYLSLFPSSVRAALLTGGLPPALRTADEVYAKLFRVQIKKNQRFYRRYPEDVERVKAIVEYLESHEVILQTGDRLTVRLFQLLGLPGMYGSDSFESLHWLIEDAWIDGPEGPELSVKFLWYVAEMSTNWASHPLYALLHEMIYTSGPATRWAAHRRHQSCAEFSTKLTGDKPFYFLGEVVLPYIFEDYHSLRPLKRVAELLAEKDDWRPLYDLSVLRTLNVPVAALVVYEDACVYHKFSEELAELLPEAKLWITNSYEHNGIRANGENILDRLQALLLGTVANTNSQT